MSKREATIPKPVCQPLTIVAPLRDGVSSRLSAFLESVEADLDGSDKTNPGFRPAELPDTHFTRFVVLLDTPDPLHPNDPPPPSIPPLLVWESNHDGTPESYLRAVATKCAPGITLIFEHCQGFPGLKDIGAFVAWMVGHSIPSAAFHCAYRGTSKAEVDAALATYGVIRDWIDGQKRSDLAVMNPRDMLQQIHAQVAKECDLRRYDSPGVGFWDRLSALKGLWPVLKLVPRIGLLFYQLVQAEKADEPESFDHPVQGKPEAIAQEDFILQNQLTHIVDVKPGKLRALVLRSSMRVINALAAFWYVDGNLAGITSIHFARWVILEDPRTDLPVEQRRDRLMFFSNYDFSWDAYLGEFVDRAARGLTAAWGSTKGFPRTHYLTEGGARDEERFKQWARNRQIRSDLWWSGVPNSTVDNVRNAVWIRRRLLGPMTDPELTEWLRRL